MSTTDTTTQDLEVLHVRGWQEPDLPLSFEPGSDYVEYCWLPVLGPTATLLLRRLGGVASARPTGAEVDALDLSLCLGLGRQLHHGGHLARAIERLEHFGFLQPVPDGETWLVRTAVPPLSGTRLSRLSLTARGVHNHLTRVG